MELRDTVEIHATLPLGEIPRAAFVGRLLRDRHHVEAQLDTPQSIMLRQLQLGLKEQGAELANGRLVESGADVVRYLLEQLMLSRERAGAMPRESRA